MNCKKFLFFGLSLLVVTAVSPVSLKAEVTNLAPEAYTIYDDNELVKESINDGSLVKIDWDNPYYRQGKPVYRATADYYKKFSYEWKDAQGQRHTSLLTDRATDRNQIIALLKEVYTNPLIPGYIEDISYTNETEKQYDWYTNQINRTDNGKGEKLKDGEWMFKTVGPNGKFDNAQVIGSRNKYNIIEYRAHDFYPYDKDIKDEPIRRPLNGATALLVEMKANYYGVYYDSNKKKNYSNPCGNVVVGGSVTDPVDKALDFIDAVTLITNQRYVDQGKTGFLFNVEGYYSKIFIISKGSPRPDKPEAYPTWYEGTSTENKTLDNAIKDSAGNIALYRGSYPFYGMYEEFSPANTQPMADAFVTMESGQAFSVDHNCSTVIGQQHDIIMGSEESYATRNTKYHINLMFFLPDLRFADNTAYKNAEINLKREDMDTDLGGDMSKGETKAELYSPYTFYAKDYQPYMFFHKLSAVIDDAVDVKSEEGYAWIPIQWESNYKSIIGQNYIPESFWVYRMINGTVQKEHIPLDQIIIRPEQTAPDDVLFPSSVEELKNEYTWKYVDEKSIMRAHDSPVLVYIRERFTDDVKGKSFSYVIKSNRTGSNFNLVESNVVTAVLPFSDDGSYMTLELERAKSVYNMDEEENVYANTINYIQIKETVEGEKKAALAGNLLVNELLRDVPKFEDGKITNAADIIIPGDVVVYRQWTDAKNNEHNDEIYRLPVDEKSLVCASGNTPVIRLVEKKVRDLESQAEMGENGLDPYRHLNTLKEKGLVNAKGEKVTDVKIAIAFKWTRVDKQLDKDTPWDPINEISINNDPDPNENRMGYFIDDHDLDSSGNEIPFRASTKNNDFATKYSYHISFEPKDATTSKLVSNTVEVLVPNRNVYAGYTPYTYDEIFNEPGKLFTSDKDVYNSLVAPNSQGVGVRVSNSALVKNYEVYRLPVTRSGRNSLVARVWRNSDGSFQPRVFDGSIITEGDQVYDDASAQDRPGSEPGYIGKVPVELAVKVNPYDRFALVINTINQQDSPYRDNTYGSKIVFMPEPPQVYITDVEMKNNGGGNYTASATVESGDFSNSPYHFAGYALWSFEHTRYKDNDWGVLYPENCVMVNRVHWLSDGASAIDDNPNNVQKLTYDFNHAYHTPTFQTPVVTTNFVRMYSRFNTSDLDNCIAFDSPIPQEYYVVSDNQMHYGLFGDGVTTGVDNITDDSEAHYRYFDLRGFEVNPSSLIPGVYIKTNGVKTEKVVIK